MPILVKKKTLERQPWYWEYSVIWCRSFEVNHWKPWWRFWSESQNGHNVFVLPARGEKKKYLRAVKPENAPWSRQRNAHQFWRNLISGSLSFVMRETFSVRAEYCVVILIYKNSADLYIWWYYMHSNEICRWFRLQIGLFSFGFYPNLPFGFKIWVEARYFKVQRIERCKWGWTKFMICVKAISFLFIVR